MAMMRRREFLGSLAAGSAVVTMPAFLAGCGAQQATDLRQPTPENPFLDWFGLDQATVARLMSELTANGADIADLYFQHARSNAVSYAEGKVTETASAIEQGVGLRVAVGDQTGFAFTEELTLPSMLAAARTAAAGTAGGIVAAPRRFTTREAGALYRASVPWADVGLDEKQRWLTFIDETARALEPAVDKVSVYWSDADERIMIATLDGRLVTDHRPMTRVTVIVTAKRGGQIQSGYANIAAREDFAWYTEERLTAMTREAVERTMTLFDARRPPAGEMPVILAAGAGGIVLHEAIGHALEADFVRDGASVYAGRLGATVAEPFVTVVDQATIPHERGALNCDDEGHPTSRNVLVENGVLTSYLHDAISARHDRQSSTGSGRRQSYKFSPMPRMTCTLLEAGPHTRDEIIAAVDRGVICDTFTTGQVELGAGDFTFNVKNGWLVEGGRVTAPLKDFTITGNGPDTLRDITMVADDARLDAGGWTCGKKGQTVPVSQGMPTTLVAKLQVGRA